MSERFFCTEPITGDQAVLADQEAHHLLHVMRLKVGASVVLFDGTGAEFDAEVRQCGRREVELAVLAHREVDRELPAPLVVGVAMPKGDRQRWLVEKLTELGVTAMTPLITERTVGQTSANSLEKLRRVVIESSKQCQRNRLMQITEPLPWAKFLEHEVASLVAPPRGINARVLAHPSGDLPVSPLLDTRQLENLSVTVAIGPEGGFTDEEVEQARAASFHAMSLGPTILRIETAAIAMANLYATALRVC
ncbi:MAG: 16S rRNA (uracil(1498)-N(3))-methyltransferase [Planctomycetota bacterium]